MFIILYTKNTLTHLWQKNTLGRSGLLAVETYASNGMKNGTFTNCEIFITFPGGEHGE
jgi:hypothetical protein